MTRWKAMGVAITVALLAATGEAGPVQVTASGGDSGLQRFGPASTGLAAVLSDGDLTPGAPGNADGSREVYLLDLGSGGLTQVTASDDDSSTSRITADRLVILGSRGDLAPGAPGNADGSFESFVFDAVAGALTQMTASAEDSFFQTFWKEGKRALFVSKGDLTPGAPGNPDGRNEVYWYQVRTGEMAQLTDSPEESLARGLDPKERFAVIQSRGDLTPGSPGNADGTWELFLLDLGSLSITQLTASAEDSDYRGVTPDGRHLACERTGAGGTSVLLLDVETGEEEVLLPAEPDAAFLGFDRKGRRVALRRRVDGDLRALILDRKRGTLFDPIPGAGETDFLGFEPRKGKWAAFRREGDLRFVRFRGRRTTVAQVTEGAQGLVFGGFAPRGRRAAFESTSDLKPGHNADGSREVFLTKARRRTPPVHQLTDSLRDSFAGGFAPDGETLVVESEGDLDPTGPGNADGSRELFLVPYR